MITYDKRDDQKLEGMMNSVKGILESIVFKQEEYRNNSNDTFYVFSRSTWNRRIAHQGK